MRKKLFLLSMKLPTAISLISLIGSMCVVAGTGANVLKTVEEAKAEASPTTLRELTLNEQQRLYLYEQVNYNLKDYQLLSRVIDCESVGWNDKAYNKETGDFGLFQINQNTWEEKSLELGYNYKENWQDNIKMGVWIYKNSGIQNWNWSKKCWK